MDLAAVVSFRDYLPGFNLTHLPSVHAKVYVADRNMAVVTSGNLTGSGLAGNIEYGVSFDDELTVSQIRNDFEAYARLGAQVDLAEITSLTEQLSELKDSFLQAQKTIRTRARRAFEQKLRESQLRLLRQRVKGKTTHAIFSESILFLLTKHPMSTAELHPDICDDSIDRVIDGQHFGKRWKHLVRNAQQHLKRQGRIRFDGKRWELLP
jgi:phosphatidylserine/phosphatidylglycerophosphate/cardiolipin synthase-like enzyme